MTPAGFEPAIPASERPQTHVLDRKTTEISKQFYSSVNHNEDSDVKLSVMKMNNMLFKTTCCVAT